MILGDSRLVMTSLPEKEGLKGKEQTIDLDPPYGIKFGSNQQRSTRRRDVKDGKPADARRQPKQVQAFRDTWKPGIHSVNSLKYRSFDADILDGPRFSWISLALDRDHLFRVAVRSCRSLGDPGSAFRLSNRIGAARRASSRAGPFYRRPIEGRVAWRRRAREDPGYEM
jgi:hypothetical protein